MLHAEVSDSGFYAECFGEDCDWWGPIERCWSPVEDPECFMCGSCMRPIESVWRSEGKTPAQVAAELVANQRPLEGAAAKALYEVAADETSERTSGPICTKCKGFGHAWFDCPERRSPSERGATNVD